MGERYSRLFALPNNIYSVGAPVIIAAGAMLKDNITGKVLAQLKLQSIGNKPIKAATVRIFPMDTAGDALGESVSYQYLDINIKRNDQFGQTVPIPLPNPSTRSFSAAVSDVIFADNTKWCSSAAAWEPLPAVEPLDKKLNDVELINQFRIEYGRLSSNFLTETKDLWFCVCGAINHESEAECCNCHNKLADLRKIDLADIEQKKNERLERIALKNAAAKKMRLKAAIAIALAVVLAVGGYFTINAIKKSKAYAQAEQLLAQGKKAEAAMAFGMIGDKYARKRSFAIWDEIAERDTIAIGDHTVALKTDGTVVAVGDNFCGRCDVSSWADIAAVAVNIGHTVGLKADGTVVAVGSNLDGQCDVSGWTDIVAVTGGDGWAEGHAVGLRADGTVVAVGKNDDGQCNVSRWKDIVAVAAGDSHTVGLKADGTVVAVGYNYWGQCDVSGWRDIAAVAASDYHTVGLKADGTVVAVGDNDDGQCNVSGWKNIKLPAR
ncbi:MAG: hypothetical protein SOV19_01270 [Eubacteriales bacterium]|nr:hypothetical protein [Christensenellaceae bacterium]MDY2747312.1 hypothetical protein [Eubacteriales bacterium]